MIKPDSLRAALAAVFPRFASNPDTAKMWLDKGSIHARGTSNDSFELRYTLNIVVEEWQGPPTALFLVINRWLSANQPDLLAASRDQSYSFEAEVIDATTFDVSIDLPLSESVKVIQRPDGGFDLQHLAEEIPMFPDMEPIHDSRPNLSEIWWRNERLIEGPPLP